LINDARRKAFSPNIPQYVDYDPDDAHESDSQYDSSRDFYAPFGSDIMHNLVHHPSVINPTPFAQGKRSETVIVGQSQHPAIINPTSLSNQRSETEIDDQLPRSSVINHDNSSLRRT
jgi:hypothetical protein